MEERRRGRRPGHAPRGMLWRGQAAGSGISRMQIKSATRGANGEILFVLDTDTIGGLFAHDPADGSERRLFHKAGFRAMHLARHPSQDLVALSVRGDQLSAHLALTDTAGHNLREITEGDSVDESPAWVPGEGRTLVFQSAGIARDAHGFQAAVGPYRIEELDLDRDTMTTLVEDEAHDHLGPRVDRRGDLYFIRRPYSQRERVSPLKVAADVLLFPFRLARVFVHFFNFFSVAFSGKPLMTAGGPKEADGRPQDVARLMLWGKVIDAEKALKDARDGESPSLVPSTWQLVRREPSSGSETVLARGVLSFDLDGDDSVVYTNGSAVFRLDAAGHAERICTGKLIEQVAVLSGQP